MKTLKYTARFTGMLAVAGIAAMTITSCGKKGCTDPLATNYDPDATKYDASCEYGTIENFVFAQTFTPNGNSHEDPGVTSTSLIPANNLTAGTAPTDSWFDNVTYKGAFDATDWTAGWTFYDGYFPNVIPGGSDTLRGAITDEVTLSANTVWYLDGFVYVEDGAELTIDAGTIIKGLPGTGADASALIIARGGTITANGTQAAPIIMTYAGDPLDGTTSPDTRGEWGGLIILGNASLNSSPGSTQVEGIPTTESFGLYGGNDDADGSGFIRYLSIRHGGTDIGAGNEINGLTLGGVGTGTDIRYVEVAANADDGVEFFGGTVNTKNLLTVGCGDDSFDYDEGFRGKGQFWVTVQDDVEGDRGGEHDGGTDPETAEPYAKPIIYNCTYVGNGTGRALTFRDNAGGEYHNSIFVNWDKGVDIEDLDSGEDSFSRHEGGDLNLAGNVFFNIGAGSTDEDLFKVSTPD